MKQGFTLSEVLITLVIIGIIATVTVPTLMANYRKQEASSRIKKFYAMLKNASTRAKADGKDWTYWAESASSAEDSSTETVEQFGEEYLFPYLNYSSTKKRSGNSLYVYLTDGTYFYFRKGSCIDFIVDVNGEKSPNYEGRDMFRFLYCPDSSNSWKASGTVIPYIKAVTTTREEALNLCKNDGKYCTGLLSFDNWEFKDDYPYSI
ncbi:MAG: type II secretion system GspH family protein [Candidatus Gastranaerophilales bacterium]|nr:type II secretion system GspH family protein [Candidatus Gastranaerophilales bacterium]